MTSRLRIVIGKNKDDWSRTFFCRCSNGGDNGGAGDEDYVQSRMKDDDDDDEDDPDRLRLSVEWDDGIAPDCDYGRRLND